MSHPVIEEPNHGGPGATIRWARLYDWLAQLHYFGRERPVRERTLDIAGITPGEHVLDVGCGTGTLALAAKRRVGASGSVYGVDASAEMIARAKAKSARKGLPVEFEVTAAQSLPFADAMFDVVLCTLAMHHLPEHARAEALAEMRRVLKPEGGALIVEFGRGQGVRALLNPVALLHARRHPRMLDEVSTLMKRAGFERVVTGDLGLGGLGYALARRGLQVTT
jgi:ubiquinone/menaquinone biosynthesis C-methylase UbiE